jgi:hypothetical protein
MKRILKIVGLLLLLIVLAVAIFIITYQPKQYEDYNVFTDLRNQTIALCQQYQAAERPITGEFSSFSLNLSFPFNKLFGSSTIAVPLKSFANDTMSLAISQFQVPAGSNYYRDFTLHIRPQYGIKAPVFHIDFMKPALGTPGLCSMDFFNPDPGAISTRDFLGEGLPAVQKALALVEPYQRTKEEGRGNITAYLDPYKSEFRLELMEPKNGDESLRKQYYTTVAEAVKMILPVYVSRLHALEVDASYAAAHEQKVKDLVLLFYKNDFAVRMGKSVFKEHFKKYWLDGFWNVEVTLPD